MGATGCRADRSKCLTHDLWEELGNQIHLFLSSVTLLDVLERSVLAPRTLLEAPAPAPANARTFDGRGQLGTCPHARRPLTSTTTPPAR